MLRSSPSLYILLSFINSNGSAVISRSRVPFTDNRKVVVGTLEMVTTWEVSWSVVPHPLRMNDSSFRRLERFVSRYEVTECV